MLSRSLPPACKLTRTTAPKAHHATRVPTHHSDGVMDTKHSHHSLRRTKAMQQQPLCHCAVLPRPLPAAA